MLACFAFFAWVVRSYWKDQRLVSAELQAMTLAQTFANLTRTHAISLQDAGICVGYLTEVHQDLALAHTISNLSREERKRKAPHLDAALERANARMTQLRTTAAYYG